MTEEKPKKKIVKKVIKVKKSEVAKLSDVKANKWSSDDVARLNEMVKANMNVAQIASQLNKSESAVRFQLKMTMYADSKNNKDITDLIDGVSTKQKYNTSAIYDDNNLAKMINVYLFLERVRDLDQRYAEICEQVKKECIEKIDLKING